MLNLKKRNATLKKVKKQQQKDNMRKISNILNIFFKMTPQVSYPKWLYIFLKHILIDTVEGHINHRWTCVCFQIS